METESETGVCETYRLEEEEEEAEDSDEADREKGEEHDGVESEAEMEEEAEEVAEHEEAEERPEDEKDTASVQERESSEQHAEAVACLFTASLGVQDGKVGVKASAAGIGCGFCDACVTVPPWLPLLLTRARVLCHFSACTQSDWSGWITRPSCCFCAFCVLVSEHADHMADVSCKNGEEHVSKSCSSKDTAWRIWCSGHGL